MPSTCPNLNRPHNPFITTDKDGAWIVAWESTAELTPQIDSDRDILISISTNNCLSWSNAEVANTNAATDSGVDEQPAVATDGWS